MPYTAKRKYASHAYHATCVLSFSTTPVILYPQLLLPPDIFGPEHDRSHVIITIFSKPSTEYHIMTFFRHSLIALIAPSILDIIYRVERFHTITPFQRIFSRHYGMW